jgi:hypothetical protein
VSRIVFGLNVAPPFSAGVKNYFILAPPTAFLFSGSPEGERTGGMDGRAVIFLPRAPRPENLARQTTDPPRIVNRGLISTG